MNFDMTRCTNNVALWSFMKIIKIKLYNFVFLIGGIKIELSQLN